MSLSPWRGSGRWLLGLALVSLLGVTGCGKSVATVTGKVYYKDKLLKGGNVTFIGPGGQAATGVIQEDGTYTVPKAPVGEVKVAVETASLAPKRGIPRYQPPKNSQSDYKPPDPAERARRYVRIPDQYADAEKSGVTLTVKGGKQELDIKLP